MRWWLLFGWWLYLVAVLVLHMDGSTVRTAFLDGVALCGSVGLLCWEGLR